MNSAALLEQARDTYRQAGCNYRDALLETGRVLHEFVLARLEEGNGLPHDTRCELEICRGNAIRDAAERLDIQHARVRLLIAASQVASLLGEGMALGGLTFAALHCFWPFLQRPRGRHLHIGETMNGPPVSLQESWRIKPGMERKAKEYFRRAIKEEWTQDRTVAEVYRAIHGDKPQHDRILSVHREAEEELDREVREERDSHKGRQRQAAVAAPGDVAEMCMDLVREAQDPRAVALCLQGKLAELLAKKRRIG